MAYIDYRKITQVPPADRLEYSRAAIKRIARRIGAQRGANRRGRRDIKAGRASSHRGALIEFKGRVIERMKKRQAALENYLTGGSSWDTMIKRLGLLKCARCGAENQVYKWTSDFIESGYYCGACYEDGQKQLAAYYEKHGRPDQYTSYKVDAMDRQFLLGPR